MLPGTLQRFPSVHESPSLRRSLASGVTVTLFLGARVPLFQYEPDVCTFVCCSSKPDLPLNRSCVKQMMEELFVLKSIYFAVLRGSCVHYFFGPPWFWLCCARRLSAAPVSPARRCAGGKAMSGSSQKIRVVIVGGFRSPQKSALDRDWSKLCLCVESRKYTALDF